MRETKEVKSRFPKQEIGIKAGVENESTGKVIRIVWVPGVVICNKGGTPSAECPAIVAKFLCIKSKADTRIFLESIYEFSNTNKRIIIIKLK